MPQLDPRAGELYRHFKGRLYQVICLAKDASDGRDLVVYQALYGDYSTYARAYEEFISGVDHSKYPDAADRYRFTLVSKDALSGSGDAAEKSAADTTGAGITKRRSTADAVPKARDISELIMEFLDERDFEMKDKLLGEMAIRSDITDAIIDNLAASIDIVIDPGPSDKRFRELRSCVRTRGKYETSRLR